MLYKITEQKEIKESIKHPSEAEVRLLINWSNSLVFPLTGSQVVKDAFHKAEDYRLKVWDWVFGDNSPWSVKRGSKTMYSYFWDEDKAKRLGL